jgi:hypothetical protein
MPHKNKTKGGVSTELDSRRISYEVNSVSYVFSVLNNRARKFLTVALCADDWKFANS